MKITEIQIKNFGMLQNIMIHPLPGINVIYGENETGKSTMQQFITGMMFGMEPSEELPCNKYQKYEPWNEEATYAGGIKFEVAGQPFLLERKFYEREKSTKLVNEEDSKELSVECGDLEKLFGGIKKTAYENTYCISQAAVETKEEFAGILQNYFVNASFNSEGEVDLLNACKKLKHNQELVEQRYKKRFANRKELENKFLMEEKLLKKDVEQLEKQREDFQTMIKRQHDFILPKHDTNQMAEYLRDINQKKKQLGYYVRFGFSWILVFLGLFVGVWNLTNHHLLYAPQTTWVIFEVFLSCLFLLGFMGICYWYYKVRKLKKIRRQQEQEAEEMVQNNFKEQEEQEIKKYQTELAQKQAIQEVLRIQILEKQAELINLHEEWEECCKPSDKEIKAIQQIKAYELAYHTLEQLSQNIYKESKELMEREISKILSDLTNGKYRKITLDENMNLAVCVGKNQLYPWQLSRGTMEQIYMALRMGTGKLFSREESMPILLDEVFASFDEKRLEAALQWLGKQSAQIFLFTCQRREIDILEQKGIPFGKIMLSR